MEIKNIYKEVIYTCDCETIKECVERAIKEKVNLQDAFLSHANLANIDLSGANLHGIYLSNADLTGANLRDTVLVNANLIGANFNNADLYEADLHGANFLHAKNVPNLPMDIPSEGEFIAWKKVGDKIIKLQILGDSKRSQATTEKCRCDKALVLEIQNIDGTKADESEITNYKFTPLTYKVGEIVYSDSWDENRWYECSHGIHFFSFKTKSS